MKADSVDCILIDSVSLAENGVMKMIKTICESFEKYHLWFSIQLTTAFFLSQMMMIR